MKVAVGATVCAIVAVLAFMTWNGSASHPASRDARQLPSVPERYFSRAEANSLPIWHGVKAAHIFHAIRLWGDVDVINLPGHPDGIEFRSGDELLGLVLGSSTSASERIPGWQPILRNTALGVEVVDRPSLRGAFTQGKAHRDDLLAACAIAKVPLERPIRVDSHNGTLNDLLRHSVASFTPTNELEWTAIAYAWYLAPSQHSWTNRFDETWTFDDLVDMLLAKDPRDCACLGLHVPYAICSILSANAAHSVIHRRTARRCHRYLQTISQALEKGQTSDGLLPIHWWDHAAQANDKLHNITAIGHHLEWIVEANLRDRPNAKCIIRSIEACDALVHSIGPHERDHLFATVSHYTRALRQLVRSRET